MNKVSDYPEEFYQPALRIWFREPGHGAASEVFFSEGCATKPQLIEKYLKAHRQIIPYLVPTAENYHFQFGRAVPGPAEVMEESFIPDQNEKSSKQ
jgi:hypothetical protein